MSTDNDSWLLHWTKNIFPKCILDEHILSESLLTKLQLCFRLKKTNVYQWIVSIVNLNKCRRYAFVKRKRDWNSLKICSFIWLDDEKYYVCIELQLQLVHWTERETSDFRELIMDSKGFSLFWIVGIDDFVWSRLAAFLRSSVNPLPLQFLAFPEQQNKLEL